MLKIIFKTQYPALVFSLLSSLTGAGFSVSFVADLSLGFPEISFTGETDPSKIYFVYSPPSILSQLLNLKLLS